MLRIQTPPQPLALDLELQGEAAERVGGAGAGRRAWERERREGGERVTGEGRKKRKKKSDMWGHQLIVGIEYEI